MDLNNLINKYLERLKSEDNNIEEYYYNQLKGKSDGTILNHLVTIGKLFETDNQRNESCRNKEKDFTLENNNINLFTEQDLKDFLNCKWWNGLKSGTQKMHANRLKQYFKFSDRTDLKKLLPKRINRKTKQLSKIDLISREDLDQILKVCNLQYRTLIMVMYEGALRIDEVLNITRKDIRFNGGYATLKIVKSKTRRRDVPLIESIPYIKEYLEINDFQSKDLLFNFSSNVIVNNYLRFIIKKLTNKFPEQWNGRKLYPHLFRHSRLTELARTKLNEAQIRQFAGWSAGSTMAKVYFHLNDDDVINILTDEAVEVPKQEPKKPKICPICRTENAQENFFCWKCNNIIKEGDEKEIAVKLITQPYEIEAIKKENKELKDEVKELRQRIEKLVEISPQLFSLAKRMMIKEIPEKNIEISETDYYPIE
ncbi:MAG: tyrosine-type recombinase/integrase [Promethearchaeota archaeon]